MLLLKILAVILVVIVGIIVLLLLLLSFAVHIYIEYDDEIKLKIRYLFYSKKIAPAAVSKKPKKEKKPVREKAAGKKKQKPKGNAILQELKAIMDEEGILGVVEYIKSFLSLVSSTLKKVLQSFVIKKLDLVIVVASDDAAETATSYGKICAGVYPAVAALSSFVSVKNHNIVIEPSFLQDSTTFNVKVHCYLRPILVLPALIKLFIGFINLTDSDVKSYANQVKRDVKIDSNETNK